MKRSDLGLAALGALVVTSGCAPQNRASFQPPPGENALEAASPRTSNAKIFAMTLREVKIGTLMEFHVLHDRSATISVSTSSPDVTDVTIVKKTAIRSHVSIKVIANGSSALQVLSGDTELLYFYITTD